MSFTSLLNKEMSVRSVTATADAYGGQSVTYATVYSARPCRINVLTAEQQLILSRDGMTATHKFFCDADMTITVSHELVVGATVYPVVGVRDYDEMGHHLTILTRRVE